jgi:hypothetical protein
MSSRPTTLSFISPSHFAGNQKLSNPLNKIPFAHKLLMNSSAALRDYFGDLPWIKKPSESPICQQIERLTGDTQEEFREIRLAHHQREHLCNIKNAAASGVNTCTSPSDTDRFSKSSLGVSNTMREDEGERNLITEWEVKAGKRPRWRLCCSKW